MIESVPELESFLKQLQQVPYIASRHTYRIAHHFLEMEPQRLQQFCAALVAAHENLIKCAACFVWQAKGGQCPFCADERRDRSVICVVETWYDVQAIERTAGFSGIYHVLGGLICPLDGKGPEDLTIDVLIKRAGDEACKEIIFALNQTPEGEATTAFIAHKLSGLPVKITCLARGMPVGSSLETSDRLTVHKALNERRLF